MKNKVTGAKYWLKLSTAKTVLLVGDILYTGSRSKLWLNRIASSVDQQAKPWMLSHTRSRTCRMLKVPSLCPPQMDRFQSMSADCKIATRPFLFCLNKAAVLTNFPPLRFHSRLNCVSMMQWSIQLLLFVLFFLPTPTKSYHCHFKQRNHWNSWENHQNHQLYSELSQIGNKSEFDYSL